MHQHDRAPSSRPGLSLCLLSGLLAILWLAGGASRPDVAGQVIVRGAAWGLLTIAMVFAAPPTIGAARPVVWLLTAALLLALLQLVPLPPALWQALPGRALLAQAMAASGEAQPWRPSSMVPGATINAASSLVVPMATLAFVLGIGRREHGWLLGLLLLLVVASVLMGLLQFSGTVSGSPFVNASPGATSGTFANRNHFALFLCFGFVLLPAWTFYDERHSRWRGPVALGLLVLLVLMILAVGSRAGLLLGALGLAMGLGFAWRGLRREMARAPRWVFVILLVVLGGAIVAAAFASIVAGRADTIQRIFSLDVGQDMRSRASATVLRMIGQYFPIGSGLGGFDPLFRIHEPYDLLKPTYFNHAHNDFLEIALDGGLFGIAVLIAGVGWWARASWRAWWGGDGRGALFPRLGSAMLLLIILASLFDYPARTPMIMAIAVIAAVWLSGRQGTALPALEQHL